MYHLYLVVMSLRAPRLYACARPGRVAVAPTHLVPRSGFLSEARARCRGRSRPSGQHRAAPWRRPGRSSRCPARPRPRSSHGVSALPDGTVLVLGGEREARDPAGMDLWQLKPTEGYAQQSATLAIHCREGFASLGAPSGTCTRNGRGVPHTARQRLRGGAAAHAIVTTALPRLQPM